MSRATYFVQDCPTCGRQLQVRVEYLGKAVACQHCRAQFLAQDPAAQTPLPAADPLMKHALLERVEQLLGTADRVRISPSSGAVSHDG